MTSAYVQSASERKETEKEKRARMADEAELYARLYGNSPHANLRALSPGFKARAARLRANAKGKSP